MPDNMRATGPRAYISKCPSYVILQIACTGVINIALANTNSATGYFVHPPENLIMGQQLVRYGYICYDTTVMQHILTVF